MSSYNYNKDKIKSELTIDQIAELVSELHGEPIKNGNVLVCKTIAAGIVRRVDVDNIDFALVGIIEAGEGVKIVALNDDVRRFAVVVFDSLVLHLLQNGDLVFGFAFKTFGHVEPYQTVTLFFYL